MLVDVLKSAPCTDCGGTFHTECMDFDHISGEKKGDIRAKILDSLAHF